MQELDIVSIKKVFADRKKKFDIDCQLEFEKTRYVRESLNMIKALNDRNGIEVQRITKDLRDDGNIEVDMKYFNGTTTVKFNDKNFEIYAMQLNGGFFVNHSETFDTHIIANINNYKGLIVLNGKFYITRTFIYDRNENIVFEDNVTVNPTQSKIEILTNPDKNYHPSKNQKNIVRLSINGFRLSQYNSYKQLFENATVEVENPDVFNRGIPQILPKSIKNKIVQIKRSRHEKNTINHAITTQMAVDYLYKLFEMDDLR